MGRQTCGWLNLFVQLGQISFLLHQRCQKLLRHLHAARAVGRCDMTTEAAVTKLYYLFNCGYPKETIKKLITTNLCGEISV